jgi:PAS domain S-box-containing protein
MASSQHGPDRPGQTPDPRVVIDSTPALIHTGLPDGYLDFFNQTWLKYVERSLEDLQGWKWTATIHPEDVEGIVGKWRACLESGTIFEYEARVRRGDGEYRWMFHRKVPLRDDKGNIVKWYGSSLDIEDRKRTEDLLRRTQAYLAEAQRLSHTGSFGWSVSTGQILWSEETFRIFQYDRTTKPTVEIVLRRVHPEDAALVKQTIERASQDGRDFDFEHRLLMPDGSVKYARIVAHAVRDLSGNLEFIGAVMDISRAKQAEDELRRSEARFQLALDTIPGLVWSALPDGPVDYLNQRWQEYTGLKLWEAEGWGWTRTIHPDDIGGLLDYWNSLRACGEPGESVVRMRRLDGEFRWFLLRAVPLYNEKGELVKWYGQSTDINDRKRAEDDLQKAHDEIKKLKDQLYKENIALREQIDKASMFEEIVGESPALQAVLARVAKVAPTDSTVLLTGETGTGKELIARAIHKRSQRASRAFVSVNCAAIPISLIASELFGHEKGAFTGAMQRRLGRFELAEGGTIFLDEVGELPPETQVTLLRVLQEREFERVGGNQAIRADVRVIAATNRNLQTAIAADAFRSDLFYRLNVFPIDIPPLRKRKEDITMLVGYFIDRYSRNLGKKIRRMDKKTLELLQSYSWPGNIRELQNVIERSVVVCETENFSVDESWLPQETPQTRLAVQSMFDKSGAQEKEVIEKALAESRGRVSGPSGAATKLGIPASTLESKVRSLKIDKFRFKNS